MTAWLEWTVMSWQDALCNKAAVDFHIAPNSSLCSNDGQNLTTPGCKRINSEYWAISKCVCEIIYSSTCACSHACICIICGIACLQSSARCVITKLCATSTVQISAVSHGRWNVLLSIPEELLGRGWKARGEEGGNMATSPLIPHPRELWPPAEKPK